MTHKNDVWERFSEDLQDNSRGVGVHLCEERMAFFAQMKDVLRKKE
ncbi:hypothetical protein [Prevotella sp. HUN102]|nr:hypothetical protein [Prevotella sp. HUN102]